MGDLQTYFYLALISLVMVSLALVLVYVVFSTLRRWARQAHGRTPLLFWLISGVVTVALLFFVFGTAGVLYGFIRYGAS
jgi:multisubunit Na+/H+ antiporter MnhB subunit